MLATVHGYLEVLDSQLQQYTAPIQPMYLSGMRSNYALLYQTFARSVWRLSENPLYESEKNLPVAPNYTTYTELRDRFSHNEIKAFHEKQDP
jgi:hypothetical protein